MRPYFWKIFTENFTGLAPAHILALARHAPPPPKRGRPPTVTPAHCIALACAALRTNLTERQLATLAGLTQPTTHRAIATGLRLIDTALNLPGIHAAQIAIIDGTLIPAHDRTIGAPSRNRRNSINVQALIDADTGMFVHLAESTSGNQNDITGYKQHIAPLLANQGIACPILGDGAYTSAARITTPARDASNRTVKNDEWRAHHKIRARIEHAFARLKDWQMMRQIRKRGTETINLCVRVAAKLHNLRHQTEL